MLGALLGTIGGGIASAFGADRQAQEAARRERFNAQMASLDTAYSPFVRGQSQRLAETERGPGVLGGLLGGALGGASTGMSLDNAYAKLGALKEGAKSVGGTSPVISSKKFDFSAQPLATTAGLDPSLMDQYAQLMAMGVRR